MGNGNNLYKEKRIREKVMEIAAEKVDSLELDDTMDAADDAYDAGDVVETVETIESKDVKTYTKKGGGILQLSSTITITGVEGTTFEYAGDIPKAFKDLVSEV